MDYTCHLPLSAWIIPCFPLSLLPIHHWMAQHAKWCVVFQANQTRISRCYSVYHASFHLSFDTERNNLRICKESVLLNIWHKRFTKQRQYLLKCLYEGSIKSRLAKINSYQRSLTQINFLTTKGQKLGAPVFLMLYASDKWADSTISDVFEVFLEHIVQNIKRCSSHTRALVSRERRGPALHSRILFLRLSQRKSNDRFQSCSKASKYPLIVLS